jgi:hypothetical protein
MTVAEQYVAEVHEARIRSWYEARGKSAPQTAFLSPLGFVAKHAAAWLYLTGTPLALVESLIVDPKASEAERLESLFVVTETIADVARGAGCTVLLGYTRGEGVARRAQGHGWAVDERPYRLVSRPL